MTKTKLSTALVSCLAALSLLPSVALAATPDVSGNITSLVSYLQSQQDSSGQITGFGGETSWTIMGLEAAGIDPNTIENSGNSVVDFLKNNQPDAAATTAWERDLLAVTAAGQNPFTFGGVNYVAKVQSFASANQIGSIAGVNDDIFGVLALISAGLSANQQIISDSVNFILAHQNSDFGWSYSTSGSSDSNDTAAAVLALKAAQDAGFTNSGLDSAITNAVNYLTSLQQADGGWEYQTGFGTDAASTAWVIQAVLGDDIVVSNGLNFLVSKQGQNGGIDGGFGIDTFTSSNSLTALAQKSFPVMVFEGTFEEPNQEEPNQPTQPDENEPGNENNDPGSDNNEDPKVTGSDKDGEVLAADTLPNTGFDTSVWFIFGFVGVSFGAVFSLLSEKMFRK
ncbi:MAG: terpene cyclase/mutase family protein [bacterium]|nr:terpene cyclase/mutase family protein [bacterium]